VKNGLVCGPCSTSIGIEIRWTTTVIHALDEMTSGQTLK